MAAVNRSARDRPDRDPATAKALSLRERQDVEELYVEPGGAAADEFRNPVALLEPQHELVLGVVYSVELVEPECDRRRLRARDEQQPPLDVVRAPEVRAL